MITPSLPTFSIAEAMRLPITVSPLAEMVPTWAISLWFLVGFDCDFRLSTSLPTAASMPRLISIGLWPADHLDALAEDRLASTVAVVVPSPAMSEVLLATSLTIWAPMLANLSSARLPWPP